MSGDPPEPGRAEPGHAKPGRAAPGPAEPGRADPGRAEPGRAEPVPAAAAEPFAGGAPAFLRHALAVVAYRGGKALRDAPPGFADFRVGPTSRTPGEILAHVGDLFEWGFWMAGGEHRWTPAPPLPWDREVERFFALLARLDQRLSAEPLAPGAAPRLLQGPIADSLSHVGQITLLRRLAGAPVRGENYALADITTGRVGPDQSAPRREFD